MFVVQEDTFNDLLYNHPNIASKLLMNLFDFKMGDIWMLIQLLMRLKKLVLKQFILVMGSCQKMLNLQEK